MWVRYPCRLIASCRRAYVGAYRGYSKLRTHTVPGPYGRSIRTFLRAVRVLISENPLYEMLGVEYDPLSSGGNGRSELNGEHRPVIVLVMAWVR